MVNCPIDDIQIYSESLKSYLYTLLTANYDNYACATLMYMLLVWTLHWTSSQVIVVTEKHQTNDYPEMLNWKTSQRFKSIFNLTSF